MKVYLVYEYDEWENTNKLDSVYGTKEKAVKRTTEIIAEKWDRFINGELQRYNEEHNTYLTCKQYAAKVAKDGGYDEIGGWEEVEVL